jgi:GTP-binding protein
MEEKIQQPIGSAYARPVVAIVGRPNVGKSTFFNRVCGKRKAIESDTPRTTRDRLYGEADWCGKSFTLIDTAGLFENDKDDDFQEITNNCVDIAISQADVILFIIDAASGINAFDREITKKLHKGSKKVFLIANKADNSSREIPTQEILSLGFGEPIFVSAISGRSIGDMLDIVTKDFPHEIAPEEETELIRVAVVGRPNVGKSTLLNSLSGEKKAIVSEIPGTTRDTNDTIINFAGQKIQITDTAGIRRRGKIGHDIERYSVLRAVKSIEDSNVVLILIDAEEGLTNQDTHLAGLAKDQGKSIVIVVNKFDIWDNLSELDRKEKMSLMLGILQRDLAFLPYVPVIFISAKNGKNTTTLLKNIVEVYKQRFVDISKENLVVLLEEAKEKNQQLPPITDFYQEKNNPPIFKLVCRNKRIFHFSHLRFLENRIRDSYPFIGTPLFIDIIETKKTKGGK